MIYIITNHPDKFPMNPIYRIGEMAQLIIWIEAQTELPIDTETFGFDPYTKKLICVQLGDFDNQYIVDCASINPIFLKPYFESKILILQNGKFDLKFFYHIGIYPRKIYDTFVVERILNCGLDRVRASLDELTFRYLQVELDKSVRPNIPREGLSPRVISYAADDVKYLLKIKEAQLKLLKKQDLEEVAKLENMFTPCLAYIEYCGFKLDTEKWKTKMDSDTKNCESLKNKLDEWVINNKLHSHIDFQIDMFKEGHECTINWSSPKQIVEFFEELGIDCSVKVSGVMKKSVEEPVIKKYAKDHEIVKLYLEFKKAEKLTTTYGENFLQQINSVTGRIHTNFKQILDTGRTSSGGKDRDKGINLVNFQNIPKDPLTRACFIAEEGNTLIIADYVGQEQIVLANKSLDPGLLKFYDEGLADMHAFVASKIYPELEGLSLDEIKSKHPEKRQKAKAAGFAISYGGNGATIAENTGISIEEGDKVYEGYFIAFPELKQYFENSKKQGLNDGYILISPVTRRKSYMHYYDRYAELAAKMNKGYWMKYRAEKAKESEEFFYMKKEVKDYFYYQDEIGKKCLNYPIQGCSAEVVKIATIFIYNWILDNNYFGKVKICNTIHDELVPECSTELAPEVAKVTKEFMEKAGRYYCKRIPLKVEPDICTYWRK